MLRYRIRPDWHVLVYQYGLGAIGVVKLLEGLYFERWNLYAGPFFPWGRILSNDIHVAPWMFWPVLGLEALLLVLYLKRVRFRFAAATFAIVFFFDALVSFQNHRLLLAIQFVLMSLGPDPMRGKPSGFRDQRVYWSMDALRWQLMLVYATSGLRKMHPEFLSGHTLSNLFSGLAAIGKSPVWLAELLQDPAIGARVAWGVVLTELLLPIALTWRRTVGLGIAVAIVLHTTMALVLPYIWIFTAQMLLGLIAFVPNRAPSKDASYVLQGASDSRMPARFLRLVWPGYVRDGGRDPDMRDWALIAPEGHSIRGYEAWLTLMSLSPVTFVVAEVARLRRAFSRAL